MLYNLFENRDFVSVFAVALLAEGVDRNQLHYICTMEDETSPSSRRAWIEISSTGFTISASRSPSSRRAWIEIRVLQLRREGKLVALLAEGVDRNRRLFSVVTQPPLSPSSRRAWIEMALNCSCPPWMMSPSSRRAWIEISFSIRKPTATAGRPPRGGRG